MVPIIKGRCWLPALCRRIHGVFSRPPQQPVKRPTCYWLWRLSENGHGGKFDEKHHWRATWHSCPSRLRADLLGTWESHSRPWAWPQLETCARWELYIQQVQSHDSAGGNAAGKLQLTSQPLWKQQLPLRSCHFTLIIPNCIFMPALLFFSPDLLLKFYCTVSLHNPHSKCISPEFITRCHLPPDPAYHFAAVYGEKKTKSNRKDTLWPFETDTSLWISWVHNKSRTPHPLPCV